MWTPVRDFDIWWKYGVRTEDGLSAGQDLIALTCHCAAAICYAWTSSFALAFFCRYKIRAKAPPYLVWLFTMFAMTTVSRMPLHSRALLVTLEALLVVIRRSAACTRPFGVRAIGLSQVALLTLATATTAALAIWTSTWSVTAIEDLERGTNSRPVLLAEPGVAAVCGSELAGGIPRPECPEPRRPRREKATRSSLMP